MTHTKTLLFLPILITQVLSALSTAEWKKKSIYQVITDRYWRTDGSTAPCPDISKYCGGTWKGLIEKMDYIVGMDFDAIWISPVQKNLPDSYHGYSIIDLYKLNQHFGTEAEFRQLIDTCHQNNISLMVDVVPNHMGSVMFNYSMLYPFNKSEYFHDYCYIQNKDYQHNQWRIVNCRLLNLPDLKQEHPFVNKTMLDWVHNFVNDYGIDGLRLDAVPHMPHWFLQEFNKSASTPNEIYIIGECFDPRFEFVSSYQKAINGLFNFPMFFRALDVYKNGKSPSLIEEMWVELDKYFDDVDALGLFLDNQDNVRFLNEVDKSEYFRLDNALAFIFYARGIPFVFYGTEQEFNQGGDPDCRWPLWTSGMNTTVHFYKKIALMNQDRKRRQIWTFPKMVHTLVDDDVYSFQRGQTLVVTVNKNLNKTVEIPNLDYKDGTSICNLFDQTQCVAVAGGKASVDIKDGMPLVFNPK